jgi:hypothetical protein
LLNISTDDHAISETERGEEPIDIVGATIRRFRHRTPHGVIVLEAMDEYQVLVAFA